MGWAQRVGGDEQKISFPEGVAGLGIGRFQIVEILMCSGAGGACGKYVQRDSVLLRRRYQPTGPAGEKVKLGGPGRGLTVTNDSSDKDGLGITAAACGAHWEQSGLERGVMLSHLGDGGERMRVR